MSAICGHDTSLYGRCADCGLPWGEQQPLPPQVIRPRPGDLEAACYPHPAVPSGEFHGPTEVCDLCGLSVGNDLMHTPPGRSGTTDHEAQS